MELFLKDKIAVVTGGGAGIGLSISRELVKEGAKVFIFDINIDNTIKNIEENQKNGKYLQAIKIDITDKNRVDEEVKNICEQFKRIDILINSAGIVDVSRVEDITEEIWDKIFNINVKSVFFCCQAVINNMKKNRYGKIVNIASQAGKTGFLFETVYSASKSAVINITQSLARELGEYGININSICPGSIDTGMNDKVTENMAKLLNISIEEKKKLTIENTPLKRKGKCDDISNMAVFLCSDKTSFMTGQSVNITGGREFH